MEVKDLRIGNYIREERSPYFTKVDFDTLQSIHYRRNMMYREIPLTDELVIRLGFKLNKNGNYVLGNYILAEVLEGGWFFVYDDFHYETTNSKVIKYVSELQNLFYFLSDQELILESLKQ